MGKYAVPSRSSQSHLANYGAGHVPCNLCSGLSHPESWHCRQHLQPLGKLTTSDLPSILPDRPESCTSKDRPKRTKWPKQWRYGESAQGPLSLGCYGRPLPAAPQIPTRTTQSRPLTVTHVSTDDVPAVDPKEQQGEADQTKGACLAGSAHGGQDPVGQQLQDPEHLPRHRTLKNQASGWEACCHLNTGDSQLGVARQ